MSSLSSSLEKRTITTNTINSIKTVTKVEMKSGKRKTEFIPLSASDKEEMSKYVFWRRLFMTFYYLVAELVELIIIFILVLTYRKLVLQTALTASFTIFIFFHDGSHLAYLLNARKQVLWCSYWFGVSIASRPIYSSSKSSWLCMQFARLSRGTISRSDHLSRRKEPQQHRLSLNNTDGVT